MQDFLTCLHVFLHVVQIYDNIFSGRCKSWIKI
nr:MAG TPA_asm: hypothetical protein [Caudoviricetes sp.]